MSRRTLLEYLRQLKKLYKIASKTKKTELLNQAEHMTGKKRRTLWRYLGGASGEVALIDCISQRGRQQKYDSDALLPHIRVIWRKMDYPSSIRMHASLSEWLPFYEDPKFTVDLREQLQGLSRSTLERMLRGIRASTKGVATTQSALPKLKSQVPITSNDFSSSRPGMVQADTVAHCGTSAAGPFISSLTLTDLGTGWTENRALPNKTGLQVKKAFTSIQQGLPFELTHINVDSGTEFINSVMIQWTRRPNQKPISFSRSRPYRKNDNCFVEQRNFTHVRELFGYDRFEDPSLVALMNEIYSEYWNPLHNLFMGSQRLLSKERVGSKIKKKHDAPKTPCQRVLDSPHVSDQEKTRLREKKAQYNPFELAAGLERKLQEFRARLLSFRTKEAA